MIRKLILTLILILSGTIITRAEQGSGSCKINGTYDYVEATAYINASNGNVSGNVTVSNASEKPLMSFTLTVIADIEDLYGRWNNKTLFSGTVHKKCEKYSSTEIQLDSCKGYGVRNITVTISNPQCE